MAGLHLLPLSSTASLVQLKCFVDMEHVETPFFFLFFFSRQNHILSRKQILTYIGRVGPKETDNSA